MPRPKVSEEYKKEARKINNLKYYEKHKGVILAKNGEISKIYYQNHKEECKLKTSNYYYKKKQEIQGYKDYFDELSSLEKTS